MPHDAPHKGPAGWCFPSETEWWSTRVTEAALVSPEVVPVVVSADPFVFVEIQPPILVFVRPVVLVSLTTSTSSRLIEVEGSRLAVPVAPPPAETRIMLREASHLTYLNHACLAKDLRGY